MKKQTYRQVLSKPFLVYLIDLPKPTQKVYFRLMMRAGRCFASKDNKELPHLLEHYLANQFMQEKEDYSAFVDLEHLDFFLLAKKQTFETKLNIFLKVLLQPNFRNKVVFENEKKSMLNEINGTYPTPENTVYRSVINARFRETDYSISNKLTNADKHIKLLDIKKYYHQFCHSGNITLFIGAHQLSPELIKSIKKIILSVKTLKGKANNYPSAQYSKFSIIRKEFQTERTFLTLTWRGTGQRGNIIDMYLSNCAMSLLIHGQQSRLFQKLRVENNLIYGVNGLVQFFNKAGYFAVSTAVETKDTLQTIELIIAEVDKIKNGEIDNKQLKLYLNECIKMIKKSWQDNWKRFDWISQDLIHRQKTLSLETLLSINNKIQKNPLLISSALKKYFDHHYLNIILVGKKVDKIDLNTLNY
ncbi:MAG: putative zinc protease [Berkelbacteria bacterium GW2011_GWA2_35_9]|uniref:Putative zinc protease n=1 Tax=Berkelbacteria bacterium GW2011_GWA2_35_9 TaxID=1618333 RepID=A0A0G0D0B2_9BACT|nr:MAG: putative zinc protease [Berkelbacteria bacterium GW2011_GWA2_35_9]